MKASEMSNKGIASHLQKMTETGLFKQVPPAARAVFVEAIERLKETDADRSLAGACRECREARFAELEESAKELRECLQIAFGAFAHDDDGPVWADSLIARTERVLKVTERVLNECDW